MRLWETMIIKILQTVKAFNNFNEDNDPYQEHDFWRFEVEWYSFYFKIDYYDKKTNYWSADASNTDITKRILTIMLTDEY